MKEYQARTAYGLVIIHRFQDGTSKESALKAIADQPNTALFLYEWETEAEADEKRLDWIEQHGYDGLHWASMPGSAKSTVRETIDAARKAPAPKVTIVDTGIEAQLRQAGSDYDTARGH